MLYELHFSNEPMKIDIGQVVHFRHTFPPVRKALSTYVHDSHVLSFHYRASGRAIAGSEEIVAGFPRCCLLAAGELDQNGLVGRNEAYWCFFTGDILRAEPDGKAVRLKTGRLNIRRSHARRLTTGEASWFLERFQELYALAQSSGMASDLRATAKLLEILAAWSEPEGGRQGEDRAVHRYRALIEQHASDPLCSLNDLAEQVGMTPNHLAGLFRREWGQSPVEYRTRLRMVRAEQLLLASSLSVAEIAREVGFPEPAYFTRVFQRAHRMGPREFARTRRLRA